MSKGLTRRLRKLQLLSGAPVLPNGILTAQRFAAKYKKDKKQVTKMEAIYSIIAIITLAIALSVAGKSEVIEAERSVSEYAEMVCLGRETSGEFGWPNFKDLEIVCEEVVQ